MALALVFLFITIETIRASSSVNSQRKSDENNDRKTPSYYGTAIVELPLDELFRPNTTWPRCTERSAIWFARSGFASLALVE